MDGIMNELRIKTNKQGNYEKNLVSLGGTSALKLEFTVSYFCAFSVGCSSIYMCCTKQQSYLYCFIIYALEWSADINRQLT